VSSGGQLTARAGKGVKRGAALECAVGCGVLHARPSAMGGVEMVWFSGGQGRGPVALPPPFFWVSRPGSGQGDVESTEESLGEAGALFGGQGLGLGLPTTVANSCFDFV
jgi:hypothetical protein